MYLIADIGGTNARFALMTPNTAHLSHYQTIATTSHENLEDCIQAYLNTHHAHITQASIAIATPVTGDHIAMTNHHWSFSIEQLRQTLKLDSLLVINDFTAQALATLQLTPEEQHTIRAGNAEPYAPRAVLGPGTGLGVSGLIYAGNQQWIPLAGEGGHVSFSPRNETEWRIMQYAQQSIGTHISAERLICGSGLSLIDAALTNNPIKGNLRHPAEISEAALAGDTQAQLVIKHFSAMLGTVAADLALTLGARGGVYLCGGILPKLLPLFQTSPFTQRFTDKGRLSAYLQDIPIYLVDSKRESGLLGASIALTQHQNAGNNAPLT